MTEIFPYDHQKNLPNFQFRQILQIDSREFSRVPPLNVQSIDVIIAYLMFENDEDLSKLIVILGKIHTLMRDLFPVRFNSESFSKSKQAYDELFNYKEDKRFDFINIPVKNNFKFLESIREMCDNDIIKILLLAAFDDSVPDENLKIIDLQRPYSVGNLPIVFVVFMFLLKLVERYNLPKLKISLEDYLSSHVSELQESTTKQRFDIFNTFYKNLNTLSDSEVITEKIRFILDFLKIKPLILIGLNWTELEKSNNC